MVRTGRVRRLSRPACAAVVTAALMLGLAMVPNRVHAQELRGLVLMADGVTPAAGVVVVLMHATKTDSIVARGVTTERGRFTLRPPPLTLSVLRLLRIGFEPMEGGKVTLARGEILEATYTLHENRVRLATIDVKSTARCQVQPTGAQLVAQLFQQARTALISSTVAVPGTVRATAINYTRQQDRRNKLLTPIARTTQTGATLAPYASIGADSLEKVGYLVNDLEGYQFYAPDAKVLLSDKFLAQHCLQLVTGRDTMAGAVGIGFRPVSNRRNYVDVEGTLWLNGTTSELQFLEYRYTNAPEPLKSAGLGGRVEYAQIPNGGWFVNNWFIRMPIFTTQPEITVSAANARTPDRVAISGYQISGGEVQDIRINDQVFYMNTGAAQAGAMPGDEVFTTAANEGAGNDAVLRGDASIVRDFCGAQVTLAHEGLIMGQVFDETRKPFDGAFVKAQWKEDFKISRGVIAWQDREVTTRTAANGSYSLCGIATNRTISVATRRTEKWGSGSFVRVTEESPRAQLDLISRKE